VQSGSGVDDLVFEDRSDCHPENGSIIGTGGQIGLLGIRRSGFHAILLAWGPVSSEVD
jgi:hypothetical protein